LDLLLTFLHVTFFNVINKVNDDITYSTLTIHWWTFLWHRTLTIAHHRQNHLTWLLIQFNGWN